MPTSRPVALVTGSATGVGRACVLQFARRGFDVVINYSRSESDALQTASDVKQLGAKVLLVGCDVSDDMEVRKMIAKVNEVFERLDVLVNNAATTSFIEHRDLEGLTESMWDRMLAVNLKGAFFVTRAAADLLRASGSGSVVNVSSVAGITGSGSSIAYCATKAGLNTMTKSLARVLAPEVRVNAVCPGPIDSRWIKEGNPKWDLDAMVAGYPIPKASQPDDIADAVLFFATGTAMTTGQILSVDGGQTLL
ncbi:SDR family NAD(P)-dependent oxidoreductase [Planctomycetes bacterium TBK1r]|uniref:Enoyl-[acyl-carrier-protein] reductase [NADPH] FabL n=1 Tax=Stieleria magnilauensis TaxID=2527963 RepID=A0ABX5XUH8_9BACT|nr:Enoyl-[acyl-carrier-protein] reductase [NADPH] FabL [Planctomycetes bacterium TBK1r]